MDCEQDGRARRVIAARIHGEWRAAAVTVSAVDVLTGVMDRRPLVSGCGSSSEPRPPRSRTSLRCSGSGRQKQRHPIAGEKPTRLFRLLAGHEPDECVRSYVIAL